MTAAALELRNVSKRFGDYQAVRDLSLEVRPGEFFFLLGPSGSGKTTTLRVIAGLEKPDGGSVLLDGEEVNDLPPDRRKTGLVFQNYALFPHKTVYQNVAFGPRMRNWPRSEVAGRVRLYLEMVGLWALRERLPSQLSGGQQQRVALARALVIEPAVLLLDEPLSNLDQKLRQHMRSELRRLQRSLGITAVYVTHDQGEALSMADRIAVLDEGRLIQVGSPETIYERPADSFVAAFIGDTNFLEGTVLGETAAHYRVRVPALGEVLSVPKPAPGPVPLAVGWPALLSVRPERLRLSADGKTPGAGETSERPPGGPPRFLCRGTIEDVVYQGAVARYQVRCGGGVRLRADGVGRGTLALYRAGQEVDVLVDDDSLALLPEPRTVPAGVASGRAGR